MATSHLTKGFMAVCAALLFAVPLVSCGGGSKPAQQTTDNAAATAEQSHRLVFDMSDSVLAACLPDTIEFGRLKEGEIAVKEVGIRNTGGSPFVIVDFKKSCGCVELDYTKKPIMPGKEGTVKFSFDSRGIQGWAYKTLVMQTSLNAGQHMFIVTAEVVSRK